MSSLFLGITCVVALGASFENVPYIEDKTINQARVILDSKGIDYVPILVWTPTGVRPPLQEELSRTIQGQFGGLEGGEEGDPVPPEPAPPDTLDPGFYIGVVLAMSPGDPLTPPGLNRQRPSGLEGPTRKQETPGEAPDAPEAWTSNPQHITNVLLGVIILLLLAILFVAFFLVMIRLTGGKT